MMNELPLFDIDIYGSWENFVEFWELMGKPPIVFNNKSYTNIMLLKATYLITNIKKLVIKDYEYNNISLDEDIGVSIHDLRNVDSMITYQNNHLQLITNFYLNYVLVETYTDDEDVFPSKESYIYYEDLNISTLTEIYELLKNNDN